MLFCCVKFSIRQLFCCVKFKYHLSSRKWQAQLCLIQWVLCELMLLDMSYLCKFSTDYIGSLVQLKQLQLDRLAFRLHIFLAFDMSLGTWCYLGACVTCCSIQPGCAQNLLVVFFFFFKVTGSKFFYFYFYFFKCLSKYSILKI